MLSLAACTSSGVSEADRQESVGLNAFASCDFAAAETVFADLTAAHPLNPYYHLNLGAARHKLGETDVAVDSYMKAIELGESAPIAMKIESDSCSAAEPAANMDMTVTTTVANMARDNLERMLKVN
jgi:hypothetical protein